MLWIKVYWTGQPSECFRLCSVVMSAITFCAEPLVYDSMTLKCESAITHLSQQVSTDHIALVTVDSDNIIIASCTPEDLESMELTERYLLWMVGLGEQ